MAIRLPRPPAHQDPKQWGIWFDAVYKALAGVVGVVWDAIDKTGSRLNEIETRPHNDLQSIEGTGTNHISVTELTEVTALDALSEGLVAKTADSTYSPRTITGTYNEINVADGDGINDNPVISLPDVIVTPRSFGDGTNQSTFEVDGTLLFEGDAVVYDDVYPSAVSVGTSGANVPSFTAYSGNMKAYEFVGAALTKELWAEFQIYHSYEEGTACVPHIHLYIPDDATGGIVRFGCEYHWDNVGDTGTVTTATVYGTITLAANAGISKNHILSFGSVTGTGKLISSILSLRIFRDPTNAGDTFAASVWLRSADVHIIKDTVGSRQELIK